MTDVNGIFEALAANPSRLAKEALLKQNKGSYQLQRAIKLALDPFVQFYIRKIPLVSKRKKECTLDQAMDLLGELSSRKVTGNAAIAFLKDLLEKVSEDDAMVIERIIRKDLDCGIQDSTVNKIWKDLIPTFPCMLASAYDEKLIDKMRFPAIVQMKMDGMRFNANVNAHTNTVEYRSRNGKLIEMNTPEMDTVFQLMAKNIGMGQVIFDGELLVVDKDEKPLDRKTGNGILNKAVKGTITQADKDRIRAVVWDVIPLKYFLEGKCDVGYHDRLVTLATAVDHIGPAWRSMVTIVSTDLVASIEDANTIFAKYLAAGQEGIILKSMDGPWEDKRAKHQIKFKDVKECDLKVVGWEIGEGKNSNRLGALLCESADGNVRVAVGTGFTDDMRDTIKEDVVGSIITVKYNARISSESKGCRNPKGIDSLFLPVFVEIRLDKTKADTGAKIK